MASMQGFPHSNGMTVPALKGIAIVGSFWNAGSLTTAWRLLPSVYPIVKTSRKLATDQWAFYYWTLSRTVPLTDLATFLICGGFAYTAHKENRDALAWKLWASAAGLMPFGWVWVWTLMLKPSDKLLEVQKAPEAADEKGYQTRKVMVLLEEFNSLMSVRMSFPWIVGGLALAASLLG